MKYVGNAFSLQMVNFDGRDEVTIRIKRVEKPADLSTYDSCIGHADTAAVVGVPCNRKSIRLDQDDQLLVAQVTGGRLPEGATTLPEGCELAFFEVEEV